MKIAACIAVSLTSIVILGLKMFIDELGRFCEDIDPYGDYIDRMEENRETETEDKR